MDEVRISESGEKDRWSLTQDLGWASEVSKYSACFSRLSLLSTYKNSFYKLHVYIDSVRLFVVIEVLELLVFEGGLDEYRGCATAV